ncbi:MULTISPECIES: MFS transporter [Spirosoma]|uniref:MFS transporter n=1 Tax=Spirosoma sordidisoli TaxID=2502893 RepID=A0A4Q2UNM2_9BACT|nr:MULTISPECIES: MFS transporter [Spirosoma]RYC69381.1 MFS transporter [Spirosoma sordidisoli]
MKKQDRYRWELLLWLWLAFFFNQADRQIFNVSLPLIKTDLGLTDAQAGLVGSLFALTLGLMIPMAGVAGDLLSRKRIIGFSLLFWSAATLLTGLSNSLIHLIVLRSLAVGGGEAFYAPAANGLISQHHHQTRALAMSIHQTSLYAGVVVSGALGGYIAQQYGWKNAFYLFGGAGVILSIILFVRLRPTPTLAATISGMEQTAFFKEALLALLRKPAARLLCGAFLTLVVVNVGYTVWTPTFLHEKFGLSVAEAGFTSMFYHHVAAFVGVMGGGWLSDRLAMRSVRYRLIIQSGGLLLGVPFIVGMGQAATPFWTFVCLAGFGFCRGLYEANLYTTLFEVIEPPYRSTAVGLSAMFAYVIAALVPFLLGYLKPTVGLSNGLSSLGLAYLLGGLCVLATLRWYFQKDQVRQPLTPVSA